MRKLIAFAALLALAAGSTAGQNPQDLPAFEVASIKPCPPETAEPAGQRMGMFRFTFPGGRMEAPATTVAFLMEWAYGILPSQHSPGPSWMDSYRFNVLAKAAGNASDTEMKLMTQALLADRFKLKFHHETREGAVLVIGLGKTPPKLFPPKDGEARAFRAIPQTPANPALASWHIVATRYSFADLNQTLARQMDRVIVNETGMDGDFDFTMDFNLDPSQPNPLEPSILVAAMREQLGLTVKAQRGPVDYLVIDNVERDAAGN